MVKNYILQKREYTWWCCRCWFCCCRRISGCSWFYSCSCFWKLKDINNLFIYRVACFSILKCAMTAWLHFFEVVSHLKVVHYKNAYYHTLNLVWESIRITYLRHGLCIKYLRHGFRDKILSAPSWISFQYQPSEVKITLSVICSDLPFTHSCDINGRNGIGEYGVGGEVGAKWSEMDEYTS